MHTPFEININIDPVVDRQGSFFVYLCKVNVNYM